MSKSDSLENAWLLLLFNNTNAANIGDATGLRGSTTAGSLYVSLHTADPGDVGNQTTNEVSTTGYGQYARQTVARSSSGWTVTANSCSPTANISFPTMTTGSGATISHIGIGTASSGTGVLLYKGTLTPNITMVSGITPVVKSTSTITED
jgi:hypothetical protein